MQLEAFTKIISNPPPPLCTLPNFKLYPAASPLNKMKIRVLPRGEADFCKERREGRVKEAKGREIFAAPTNDRCGRRRKKGARSRSHTNTTGTGKTAALASVVNAGLPVCQVHLTRVCPAKKVILDAAIEMISAFQVSRTSAL